MDLARRKPGEKIAWLASATTWNGSCTIFTVSPNTDRTALAYASDMSIATARSGAPLQLLQKTETPPPRPDRLDRAAQGGKVG